jgi:DNA-binding winged helix-turn-helix (wHTH) protein
MSALRHRFAGFVLDPANRTLHRDGEALSLNSRYFDALVLLVREQGRLVGKQRLFDEVWAGSVVTDSALTQCIKEIRRVLGDDAAAPRFIGTVAGHGYRFMAAVSAEPAESAAPPASLPPPSPPAAAPPAAALAGLPDCIAQALWPASGGAMAGVLGGLIYGSLLAFAPQAQGVGTLSVLLVMLALSALVGMAGALGLGLGMAIGRRFPGGAAGLLAGAAVGGLVVGGLVKLLASDAFTLLVGRAPAGITGGLEGAAIGLALAAGLLLGGDVSAARAHRPVVLAALATGLVGGVLPLLGGSLMASSLARVAATFDQSRLDLSVLALLIGQTELGLPAQVALGGLEGAIFGACVAGAMVLGRRC